MSSTCRAASARGLLAWAELITGQPCEAQRLFEHSLELDRNFAETHGGIAAVAAMRGDQATATKEIAVANRLDPKCLSAKFAESVLKRAADDPAGAQTIVAATITDLAGRSAGPLATLLASLARR